MTSPFTGGALRAARRRGWSAAAVALALVACRGDERTSRPAPKAGASRPSNSPTRTWHPDVLNRTAIAGAHILVTYRAAPGFPSILPLPPILIERGREEARRRARELLAAVRSEPDRFASVARAATDDIYTRRYGGRFGVTGPAGLPEPVADALLLMNEGEIAGPVESPVGFHILLKLPVPPAIELSGRTLVVAYAGSPDSPLDDPSRLITRTRAEAEARASELLALARKAPERFSELVRGESDGIRAADGGFLGTWWTNDPRRMAPCLTMPLLELEVGALSEVIETPFGFQIFQRLSPTPIEQRAATALIIRFAAPIARPRDRTMASRAEALAQAHAIVGTLRRAGADADARFETYRTAPGVRSQKLRWPRGDNDVAIDLAVDRLAIGGFSDPVVSADQVVVLRRDDPASAL